MKILGISASGRKNRMIHNAIKKIVNQIDLPSEVISLSGKSINGCTGCTLCAGDNICKQKDDWNVIGEKMREADIIIFGAPNYYGTMNALGHACLERTFSFRHLENFSLKGKLGISLSTTRNRRVEDPVKEMIERFMHSNQLDIIGHVAVRGYNQCYTCGYGIDCAIGNVVKDHGYLDELKPEHYPLELDEQDESLEAIEIIVNKVNKKLSE